MYQTYYVSMSRSDKVQTTWPILAILHCFLILV